MICPITNNWCKTNGCGEKCYKRDSLGYSTAPQHDAKLPVSSSSFADWRNDEYNDVDEGFYDNEPEHSNEAENCHCGAYKWSNGRWLHVSDCCC